MFKFNHQIEVIFKKVFIINCFLQLLIFHFLFIFYHLNLNKVQDQIKIEVNKSMIKFKDIFFTYYQQKFVMVIEDLIILKNAFEMYNYLQDENSIKSFINKAKAENDFQKCLINLSTIKNDILFKRPWISKENHLDENFDDYNNKVMIGSWFERTNITVFDNLTVTQQKNLAILCKMNNLIKNIFEKYIQWSFKFPIQVDFAHFSFNDSLFYKFPAIYSENYTKKKQNFDGDCKKFDSSIHIYNPKCRPFYITTVNSDSEITITLPYKQVSTQKYGNEVCLRSGKNNQFNKNEFNLVICININYLDIDSFRSQLNGHLLNKKLYLVYINKDITLIKDQSETMKNNTFLDQKQALKINVSNCSDSENYKDIQIDTIYSSEIPSEDFFSLSKFFNQTTFEDNNFYDILNYRLILKDLVPKLNDTFFSFQSNQTAIDLLKTNNITSENYKNDFSSILDNYQKSIKCPMIQKALKIYNLNKKGYSENSNDNSSVYDLYSFSFNKTVDFIDPNIEKNNRNVNIDFFIFPVFNNYNLTVKNKIEIVNNTNFFMIVAGKFSNEEIFKKFQLGLLYKFLIYLFSLTIFNILLWFAITGFIFYVFKIFFYPLKKIMMDYRNLYFPEVRILS